MNVDEAQRVLEYAIRESGVDAYDELEFLVSAVTGVQSLVESDRDVDGNVGTGARWSTAEIEHALKGEEPHD